MPEMNEYLSLTEFAKLHGLSRPWVWRLIQAGRIPAVKIGATWAIPKGTPKPEDNRVKSSKYKNWRKKSQPPNAVACDVSLID